MSASRRLLLAGACSLLVPEARAPTTRELFETEGFFVLRGLLEPSETRNAQRAVMDYLRRNGSRHAPGLMGARYGGWFLGGFPSLQDRFPEAESLMWMMHSKRKLREALTDVLGPHRLTSRAEVYVDRYNVWHVDTIYMAYGHYAAPLQPEYRTLRPDAPWELCRHIGPDGAHLTGDKAFKGRGEACAKALYYGSVPGSNETSR